jgi:hypothetical protein
VLNGLTQDRNMWRAHCEGFFLRNSISIVFTILFNLAATCLGRTTIFMQIYTSEINMTGNNVLVVLLSSGVNIYIGN